MKQSGLSPAGRRRQGLSGLPEWRWRLGVLTALALTLAAGLGAQPAWFVHEGALVRFDGEQARRLAPPVQMAEVLGTVEGGAPVVKLGAAAGHHHDHDCGHDPALADIAVLDESGAVQRLLAENAFRAFPSPSGTRIALIDADYTVHILEGETRRTLDIEERTVLVAWAPDESRLCLTVYPADWRFNAASTADGPDDFLRLINNDLMLYELEHDHAVRLTDHPGYDYGGLFSPDGDSIFFISSRAGRGAFHRVDLATRTIEQLTNLEPGSYDVPVARSQTMVWLANANAIAYEAQETPELSSIRTIGADGRGPRTLGLGSQPRAIDGGRAVAFLETDGTPVMRRLVEEAP